MAEKILSPAGIIPSAMAYIENRGAANAAAGGQACR
jgi:hypothetical protein